MLRKTLFILSIVFISSGPFAAAELPPVPEGPLLLTSVTPEQLNPDYWIRLQPNADGLIKDAKGIRELNTYIQDLISERMDIFKLDKKRSGSSIREVLQQEYATLKGRKLFDEKDRTIEAAFFENKVHPVSAWEKTPKTIEVRWGASTWEASVRALPTDQIMLEEKGDIEFDQLQYTRLKRWTPLAVYHTSSDGDWYYVQAPYVRGWVKAKHVALFNDRDSLKHYAEDMDFLMITGESVHFYLDAPFQTKAGRPSMGTRIPLAGKSGNAYEIWWPERQASGWAKMGKRYIPVNSDVSEGFLPYTQANVIRQAFKLLGERYGWGGAYYGRDCSGFTFDVFLTFGIDIPRNSKEQALIGTQIDYFSGPVEDSRKIAALNGSTPAITLLTMPLHQMLYLGRVGGRHYIIHSTWAERISMSSDEKRRINQVVVSDLSLNGNSYLGSLFSRITSINEVA